MLHGRRDAWLQSIVFAAACSSAKPAPPAPSAIIDLKELTVRFDDMPIARLHADGRTESVGNTKPGKDAKFSPGPTLHADGTIDLKSGFKARVESNGDIFVVSPPEAHEPEHLYGRISGDHISNAEAHDSGVRVDGSRLVTFDGSGPTNVLGVIDPPSMGRTALLMTAAFFIDMAIATR
jgi:hypothetical protein